MANSFDTISPVDGSIYVSRDYASMSEIDAALELARFAQAPWAERSVAERAEYALAFVDALEGERARVTEELAWQMGRPVRYNGGEIDGTRERVSHMARIADASLAPIVAEPEAGHRRWVAREPHGIVLTIAPWNYPYLTAINSILPAMIAGNVVILKHARQTPLVAERLADAFKATGLPEGVFQYLHMTHEGAASAIKSGNVNYVSFTGGVPAGAGIEASAAGHFIPLGLELGGKDPAYVRADADLAHAIPNVADGAFFNTGQCCCGIERIYVHDSIFDEFVEGLLECTRKYVVGNPLDPETELGPMASAKGADFVRGQIADAVRDGATSLIPPDHFPADAPGTPYLAPALLTTVNHQMRIMQEESFGPVAGIMRVSGDDEAVQMMNDSEFGLTASVWTRDLDAAESIGKRVETGTFFANRCDYLDPSLVWTGVKNSGRGAALSQVGYEALTRPKSYYLRDIS